MAKVLRLHKQANDNITDWGKCAKYGLNVINQIEDPAGALRIKFIVKFTVTLFCVSIKYLINSPMVISQQVVMSPPWRMRIWFSIQSLT